MSVTLYNMEQEIIILEGEVATRNIMIESLQRELDSARKTIARLYRQIEVLRGVGDDDQEPTNEPADH